MNYNSKTEILHSTLMASLSKYEKSEGCYHNYSTIKISKNVWLMRSYESDIEERTYTRNVPLTGMCSNFSW